ncbi:MAG: LLM class flavin-dependent oxidoreductase [Dehalococcoidia bacterium]
MPYHHPAHAGRPLRAARPATRGRSMLGVGPGALVSDAWMMGIDPVSIRPRMDEALGVIIRLLNGEVVTHKSDWFEPRDARLQLLPHTRSVLPHRQPPAPPAPRAW